MSSIWSIVSNSVSKLDSWCVSSNFLSWIVLRSNRLSNRSSIVFRIWDTHRSRWSHEIFCDKIDDLFFELIIISFSCWILRSWMFSSCIDLSWSSKVLFDCTRSFLLSTQVNKNLVSSFCLIIEDKENTRQVIFYFQ